MKKSTILFFTVLLASNFAFSVDRLDQNKKSDKVEKSKDQQSKNQQEKARVGLLSKIADKTGAVVAYPFQLTARGIRGGYNCIKGCGSFIYRTADTTIYVVGLSTTVFVIYCICKGSVKREVLSIEEVDGIKYYWSTTGIPVFGEFNLALPEEFALLFESTARIVAEGKEQMKDLGVVIAEQADKVGVNQQNIEEVTKKLKEAAERTGITTVTKEGYEYCAGMLADSSKQVSEAKEALVTASESLAQQA